MLPLKSLSVFTLTMNITLCDGRTYVIPLKKAIERLAGLIVFPPILALFSHNNIFSTKGQPISLMSRQYVS